jgi:hypothetical protein
MAWNGAHEYTSEIAERLAGTAPGRYTTSAALSARPGKLFIDYLRNGRGTTAIDAFNTIPDGQIPLWARRARGRSPERIQLVAAWNLAGLDNPSSFESIRVWIDERGKPRGVCRWGYREPLSFRYQAIISAAGPVAEAGKRRVNGYNCLMAGEDHDIIMRLQSRRLV